MEKKLIIDPFESFSLQKRFSIFLGVFGGTWLLIEPMGFFNIAPELMQKLGYIGYSVLFGISFLITFLIGTFYKKINRSRIEYMPIVIFLTQVGEKYDIMAPKNIIISNFLGLFFKKLNKEMNPGRRIHKLYEFYEPHLVLIKENNIINLDQSKTLKDAGIISGDFCKIKGIARVTKIMYYWPLWHLFPSGATVINEYFDDSGNQLKEV